MGPRREDGTMGSLPSLLLPSPCRTNNHYADEVNGPICTTRCACWFLLPAFIILFHFFLHRTQLGIALFAGQFIIASRLSLCVWPYHFSLYSQVQNEREWESGVYTTNHSMTFHAVGGQSDRFLAPPAGSWSMRRLFSIKLFPPFFAHQPPIWSISEWDSSVQKQKE